MLLFYSTPICINVAYARCFLSRVSTERLWLIHEPATVCVFGHLFAAPLGPRPRNCPPNCAIPSFPTTRVKFPYDIASCRSSSSVTERIQRRIESHSAHNHSGANQSAGPGTARIAAQKMALTTTKQALSAKADVAIRRAGQTLVLSRAYAADRATARATPRTSKSLPDVAK